MPTARHFIWLVPFALLCCLGLLLLPVPTARADGGAPNLAYIAGGNKGISVVDVAKQGVTGSISVGGDPNMILLSLDGRFLYVTQPQSGRVAIVAASTGDTICTANIAGQPTLLALDNNNGTFFVAGNGASSVTALDTNNCNVKHTFTVTGHVYGLAIANIGMSVSSSSSQLWVADDTSLQIFDDSSGQQLGNVPIAGGHSTFPFRPVQPYILPQEMVLYSRSILQVTLPPNCMRAAHLVPWIMMQRQARYMFQINSTTNWLYLTR